MGLTLFGYDAQDNLTSVTDPRSLVTSYGYNGFGDLLTQTSPDTGVTTNTYDSAGNLDTSTDSRGSVSDYDYDAANRVTSVSFTLGGVTNQTISYGYDAGTNQNGRLTSASDAERGSRCFWEPVAICDRFRASVSWAESRNMKSTGNRAALRLTCSFRRLVVTP